MKRLLRHVHYWLSLAVFIPSGIIFFAGIFLLLKKEIGWIQPPTERGSIINQMPQISYEEILSASQSKPEAGILLWSDIKKIDYRPDKGIAKVISKTGWEVQVDTGTGEALSANYRRSDLIESLHDGSFFAKWVKLYIFLPVGLILIIMWGTGIYLFCLPQIAKARKRARKKKNRAH